MKEAEAAMVEVEAEREAEAESHKRAEVEASLPPAEAHKKGNLLPNELRTASRPAEKGMSTVK